MAHGLSVARVAADLVTLKDERYSFADIVQRLYTDDGRGDGHLTLSGMRSAPMILHLADWAAVLPVPVWSDSRAGITAKYNRLMDLSEANFLQPVRDTDAHQSQSQILAMSSSPTQALRFSVLREMLPAMRRTQEQCELYLGRQDGTIVGIALELYRREKGKYPSSLIELTPHLLPNIPADRITGNPVKYRVINGKPVVYSVGADRVDDGGKPPETKELKGRFINYVGGSWDDDPEAVPRRGLASFRASAVRRKPGAVTR